MHSPPGYGGFGSRPTMVVRRKGSGLPICSRAGVLAALVLLLTCAWTAFVFAVGRCRAAGGAEQQRPRLPINSTWASHALSNVTWESRTSKLSVQSIVFGIAGSSQLWSRRKEFIRLWWRPRQMRGFVWLEEPVDSWDTGLPPLKVSEDTLRAKHTTYAVGHPTGVRISRIVLETFKMGLPGVEWFVLCDDDTILSVDNLVRVLSKYDSSQLYYVGSISESHQQNVAFSYEMAFGGGGFALSYPLAEALAGMQDDCLQHYPDLMGSDDRLQACISELGVPLTREIGFHQCDVRGNAMGLLAAHPIAPFVSLHHVEVMEPVFPDVEALQGLQMLSKAMQIEASSFLQQAICYDRKQGLTFSVSSGYVVQVFPQMVYPKTLQRAELTFTAWNRRKHVRDFDLDTRLPFWICRQPFLYFLDDIRHGEDGASVVSQYKRYTSLEKRKMLCWSSRAMLPERIRVDGEPLSIQWYKAPRRRCCEIGGWKEGVLNVRMGSCKAGETII